MERVLTEREPVQQNERNLSQMSKIFFGVDIFQGESAFNVILGEIVFALIQSLFS